MLISRTVKRIILLLQGLAGLLVITVNGILLYQYLHRADCTQLKTQPQTSDDFVQATKNFGECVQKTVNDKEQPLEKKLLLDESEPPTTVSPPSQVSPSAESSPYQQALPEEKSLPLEPATPAVGSPYQQALPEEKSLPLEPAAPAVESSPSTPVTPLEPAVPSEQISPSSESSPSDNPSANPSSD